MPKRVAKKRSKTVMRKKIEKAISDSKKGKKEKSVAGMSRSPSLRKHLEALGESALVDLVLEIAKKHGNVRSELTDRFSTADERFVRLEKSIRNYRSSSVDYDYGYYGDTGTEEEIRELVDGIAALEDKPEAALELLALLFEKDEEVMESANQYEDCLGDVFTNDATDLFGKLARKIENKKLVEDILFRLLPNDDYGTRMDLIADAHLYLSKGDLKSLIERFVNMRSKTARGTYGRSSLRSLLKELLSQCKEPGYFESTLLEFDDTETPELCFDVAKTWFEARNYLKAHDWLQKIPETNQGHKTERLEMLRVIQAKRKDKTGLAETARELLKTGRTKKNFDLLVKAVGEKQRNALLAEQIVEVEKNKTISYRDVEFLTSVGAVGAAEEYLWRRLAGLSMWGREPLMLAKLMESKKRPLIATMLYRMMVESILTSAKSKDYPTAIAYINDLKRLAVTIKDWKSVDSHKTFIEKLREKFPKRPSFWPKVEQSSKEEHP